MAQSVGAVALDIVAGKNTLSSTLKSTMNEAQNTVNSGSSGISNALGKIGSVASAVGKTVAVGIGAGATAVAGLATSAVKSYADFEQLVGGVETLFGAGGKSLEEYAESVGKSVDDAEEEYHKLIRTQNSVLRNAENAYKTAGLSQNEYMETVTSFSASLIQSVGGDTQKASELANQAIIDMSDNANKMGTSMEMIQNAYNGFAKGNMTMLDNLKLGYGGTKEEMARLLADAEKISGIKYDISSYADIVSAINVIQTEMGITGTTAKEASSTISGSIGMMKSAWQNLITDVANGSGDIDDYIDAFVESVGTVAKNVLPTVMHALSSIVYLIQELAPKIIDEVPKLASQLLPAVIETATSLIQAIVDVIPDLVDAIVDSIPAFIEGFVQVFNAIVQALPTIMDSLVQALPSLIPMLVNALVQMIVMVCQVLPQIIQPIIDNLPLIITTIVNVLIQNLPILIQGLISLVMGIVQAIPQLIQPIIDNLPTMIISIVQAILQNLPAIIQGLISLVMGIVQALPQIIQALVDALPTIVELLVTALLNNLPLLIAGCIQLVGGLVTALPQIFAGLLEAVPAIFKGLWKGIKNVFSNVGSWFKDKFEKGFDSAKNAWSNAKATFSNIKDKVTSAFSKVGGWFKDKFKEGFENSKNAWSNAKGTFSSIKDKITSAFSNIKDKLSEPFGKARDKIKKIADKIKGFFKGKIDMPKIKLPHFSVKPKGWKIGDLVKGKIPKLGIDWYAKAMNNPMIMTKPTIFGYNAGTGNLLGGGEAGSELIVGTNTLLSMIRSAVASVLGGAKMSIDVPALQNVRAGSTGSDSGLSDKMDRLIELFKRFIEAGDSDMTVPIYIGNELIDEYILNKNNRNVLRSGGHA